MQVLLAMTAITLQAVSSPEPATPSADVVVVGHRFTDALARCLAERCPPEREVEAAMNAAAELFRNGRYDDARTMLYRTISRNKQYAAQMPGKISDLYATHADVSSHWGAMSAYQSSTRASSDVLRKYLGPANPATLVSRSQVGDMLLASDMPAAADEVYRDAAQAALANGQTKLAAYATFRRAWLAFLGKGDERAEKLSKDVLDLQGNDPELAGLVHMLRMRMAIRKNDEATIERLRATWPASPIARPYLLSEPPMPSWNPTAASLIRQDSNLVGAIAGVSWIDVGYWIRPNGATEQVEVLRSSRGEGWANPLLSMIAKRRYAPLSLEPGSPGLYRIDRFSLRNDFDTKLGSRIVGRNGPVRIVMADMTPWEESDPRPK